MRNRMLLAGLTAMALATSGRAATITQWNFNSEPPDGSATTGTLTPNLGSGLAVLVGGTTATFASGDASGGSTDPVTGTPTNDSAWNTTTYAAQGSGDKTRGVQFNVDTTGFEQILVSWDQRHSNTASRFAQFQYTLDGSTFVDFASPFVGNAGDTWFNNRSVDLTSIAGASDNSNFGFRIVATFEPGTSAYLATNPTSTYGAAGTWRFDMVTISGTQIVTAIPEPASLAGLIVGLSGVAALAAARRRAVV